MTLFGAPRLDQILPYSKTQKLIMGVGMKDSIVDPKDQISAFYSTDLKNKYIFIEQDGDHYAFDAKNIVQRLYD